MKKIMQIYVSNDAPDKIGPNIASLMDMNIHQLSAASFSLHLIIDMGLCYLCTNGYSEKQEMKCPEPQ